FLHMSARNFTRNISASPIGCSKRRRVTRFSGWRRDLAVERHGGLQRNERYTLPNEFGESFVQLLCFLVQAAGNDFDAGCPQAFEPFASHLRIWVLHRGHNSVDSGCDHSVSARRCASLVRAWFQIDVEGCTASPLTRMFNRKRFSVF